MKRNKRNRLKGAILLVVMAVLLCSCAPPSQGQQEKEPIHITIWSYYNGAQLSTFNELIKEFNSTVGFEQGIVVENISLADVNELAANVENSAKGKVGSEKLPNIFACYANDALTLDQLGIVADLTPYLTQEERELYIDSYIEEGDISGDGRLKIFPIAKSTEALFLNKTDWEPFAQATGATYNDLATVEGLTATAQAYYEWTDSLTPEKDDGKALFGRDAMANFFLISAAQLDQPIFQEQQTGVALKFDRDTIKKLWDNYYVPFVKGYFAASGRFRSDDIKTGNILCYIGSTSSATFFPERVIMNDGGSYSIDVEVLPCPRFENGRPYVVQQGAGMAVTALSEEEIAASVQFLKWFTQEEQNIKFSVGSGYMPVTKQACDLDTILAYQPNMSDTVKRVLEVSIDTIRENEPYTIPALKKGEAMRKVLEYSMSDLAAADRAVVVERLEAGVPLEEAVAEFVSERYFDAWYRETVLTLVMETE